MRLVVLDVVISPDGTRTFTQGLIWAPLEGGVVPTPGTVVEFDAMLNDGEWVHIDCGVVSRAERIDDDDAAIILTFNPPLELPPAGVELEEPHPEM